MYKNYEFNILLTSCLVNVVEKEIQQEITSFVLQFRNQKINGAKPSLREGNCQRIFQRLIKLIEGIF